MFIFHLKRKIETSFINKLKKSERKKMKRSIIDALNPVEVAEDEEVAALGNRGVWVNKAEVKNWRGPIPITDYKLNDDALPDMITKTIHQPVEYTQDISVKYLKPPTPPAHGDLVIRQENDVVRPVAPPQIIRQLAPRPRTPEPLVIREKPPQKPSVLPREVITLPGTVYDPPAREVIVERMATYVFCLKIVYLINFIYSLLIF